MRLPSPKHTLKPSSDGSGADTFEVCPLGFSITTLSALERSGSVTIHGAIAEDGGVKIRQRQDVVPTYGASSIHSAERFGDLYLTVLLKLSPVVTFVNESVQRALPLHLPSQVSDAVMTSPGLTASGVVMGALRQHFVPGEILQVGSAERFLRGTELNQGFVDVLLLVALRVFAEAADADPFRREGVDTLEDHIGNGPGRCDGLVLLAGLKFRQDIARPVRAFQCTRDVGDGVAVRGREEAGSVACFDAVSCGSGNCGDDEPAIARANAQIAIDRVIDNLLDTFTAYDLTTPVT